MFRFAHRRCLAGLTLSALFVCACGLAGERTVDPAPTDAAYRREPTTWRDVAHELDAARTAFDLGIRRQPYGDLERIADVAERAAAAVRLGYGPLEDERVPEFATLARRAESWLLNIALEARAGHGDLAADVYRNGREQHCTRCHDAHQRVHG